MDHAPTVGRIVHYYNRSWGMMNGIGPYAAIITAVRNSHTADLTVFHAGDVLSNTSKEPAVVWGTGDTDRPQWWQWPPGV